MVQFCYLKLFLGSETLSRCMFERIVFIIPNVATTQRISNTLAFKMIMINNKRF